MTNPDDRRYTAEHQWVTLDGDGSCTVGITWFAQDQLGDVTYVDLPERGEQVEAGRPYGVIESTKSVSDLYAPLSGEVVEVNADLADEPTLVNSEPYGRGWLVRIQPEDARLIDSLLTAEQYTGRVAT